MFGIACVMLTATMRHVLAMILVFKLLTGRDPVTGSALASQPTLSKCSSLG